MAQRNFLVSTTALSLTASGTTVTSGNTQSSTFVVARTLVRSGIGAGELLSGAQTWNVHYVVSDMATPYEMRLKLQRLNSGGTVQSESSFGTTRSATGTYDDPITWDSGTWAANDQLALVWEHRRPSGSGNKNATIDANGASYVDAAQDDPNVEVALTGVAGTGSVGGVGVSRSQGLTGNQITGAVGSVVYQRTNQFAASTFVVGANVALSAYEGQINGTWTKHPDAGYSGGEYNIDAATDRVWQANTVAYYSNGIPASADYYAECEVFCASTIAQNIGPAVRMDTTANTMYTLRQRDGIDWQLRKILAGVQSTLATATTNVPGVGQSKRARICVRGDQVWGEIEGGTVIGPVTDTDITAAGRAGIRGAGVATSSTGFHVRDFIASNLNDTAVALAGVIATVSVGTLTPNTGKVLSGVEATGAVGTVTASQSSPDITLALSGVAATGAVGTLGVSSDKALSGVEASTAIGSVSPSFAVPLNGVAGTAALGSLNVTTTVPVSGVQGTGAVGSLTASSDTSASQALTGVQATGSPGTLTPGSDKAISGVQGAGESGSVGVSVTVALTGVQATGQAGSITPATGTGISGNEATGQAGQLAPVFSIPLSGNQATGDVGSVIGESDTSITLQLSGVSAIGQAGSLVPVRDLPLSGVEGVSELGELGLSKGGSASLTGVQAEGQAGSLAPGITALLSGNVAATSTGSVAPSTVMALQGVTASGEQGSLTVSVDIGLTGVQGNSAVGSFGLGGENVRTLNSQTRAIIPDTGIGQFGVRGGQSSVRVRNGR